MSLEQELQYYKELYEIEKETNELNEIKLNELNQFSEQDQQRHERELNDMRTKLRRMETAANTPKVDESAIATLRQRLRQLELENNSLTERVRIAENQSTKLEEDCRAKDFLLREQQNAYDACLSKCNALELMLMSTSNIDGNMTINTATLDSPDAHNVDKALTTSKHSPNTDTTSETVPESPIDTNHKLLNGNSTTHRYINGISAETSQRLSAAQENGAPADPTLDHVTEKSTSVNLPAIYDINTARKFCKDNPDNVDGLLRFADFLQTARKDNGALITSQSFDSSSGRTPLAVLSASDMVNDLKRLFSERGTRPSI